MRYQKLSCLSLPVFTQECIGVPLAVVSWARRDVQEGKTSFSPIGRLDFAWTIGILDVSISLQALNMDDSKCPHPHHILCPYRTLHCTCRTRGLKCHEKGRASGIPKHRLLRARRTLLLQMIQIALCPNLECVPKHLLALKSTQIRLCTGP